MNFLFLSISLFLITGCQQGEKPRQYTEVVSQTPQAPQEQMADAAAQTPQPQAIPAAEQKLPDNPHAGINFGVNITPDARANLQKMLSEGQDPHAGIDMSQFAGNDPHAGLNMPAMMGDNANTSNPYTWVLPKGWKQGPDKVMRLASFYKENDPDAIDCYIVSLPGPAGGLEPNLKRWMGQIALEPTDDNYHKLLNTARTIRSKGGLEAKFYDLMSLRQSPSPKSMIAAMITTNEATIFVKMTGTSEHVKQNRGSFLEFLKSLGLK